MYSLDKQNDQGRDTKFINSLDLKVE